MSQRSGMASEATERMEALLARHGKKSTGLVLPLALRYQEGVLESGKRVAALGRCHLEPDPEPRAGHGYRERAQRLVLESTLLSDDPRATR